jgi:hypothetical protein
MQDHIGELGTRIDHGKKIEFHVNKDSACPEISHWVTEIVSFKFVRTTTFVWDDPLRTTIAQ